jgi:hypothetical protein
MVFIPPDDPVWLKNQLMFWLKNLYEDWDGHSWLFRVILLCINVVFVVGGSRMARYKWSCSIQMLSQPTLTSN